MWVLATLSASLAVANAWSPWRHHGGHGYGPGADSVTVSTTSGKIHGKIEKNLPDVRQFLGIPYSKPPIGDLRWAAPEPLSQPDEEVEATELPPSCNQFLGTGASVYTRDVLQFNLQGLNQTGSTSEDCLKVSVWAPATESHSYGWSKPPKDGTSLPVLIFIYGGGFATGGIDVPYQIPAQWINRSPNHIVVSFNYRLNIFGFPNAAGLPDQNLGLLDQRAAVEWCYQNIAAFGGDPERMVIWGQSAGAASVDYYNYAYPEDPIVKGLIMDSGTALIPIGGDASQTNFTFVANQLGCEGDDEAVLACMRKVPADDIENFVANYSDSGASPRISFGPTPDSKVVFANYTERALAGDQAKIPAIIGTNAQDGVPFAPYSPSGPNQTLVQQALLTTFFCPATETIRLRQTTGRLTYSYRYVGNFSNISPRPWMGAYHSAELPLIMGTHPDFRSPSTELEEATSRAMQDAWVAFASDPVNGLKGEGWEVYAHLGAMEVREFGMGVAVRDVSVAEVEGMCDGAAAKL